jgi:hypothetical protein
VCNNGACPTPLQLEETYYINEDTYKEITLPTYTLSPTCNKELSIYFTDAETNEEITWINFNSTTNAYEIFSDDLANTGTHIININTGVKNYIKYSYDTASATATLVDNYCGSQSTLLISSDNTRSAASDCAEACEDYVGTTGLGCSFFELGTDDDDCYLSAALDVACIEYSNTD